MIRLRNTNSYNVAFGQFLTILSVICLLSCQRLPTYAAEPVKETISSSQGDISYDDLTTHNQIFKNSIKTVQLYPSGRPLESPYIRLGIESVTLEFDDLISEQRTLYYTVLHCDANWEFSDIDQSEYLRGFNETTIDEVDYSFNTMVDYVHYSLSFPNDMMQTSLSGNYLIYVFEDGDRDEPIMAQRFVIYEMLVDVVASAQQPNTISEIRTGQEIDLTVNYPGFPLTNPYDWVQVNLIQNGRWDNMISLSDPTFARNDELVYDNDKAMTFMGGDEWRNFDIKDYRFVSPEVLKFERADDHWNVILRQDPKRSYSNYRTISDINGQFFIQNDQGLTPALESDYMEVHFELPFDYPFQNEDVYVFGALSNWQALPDFKMSYDASKKAYAASILLKQGYYNYFYSIYSQGVDTPDIARLEGSHYETQNDYAILVYHEDMLLGYDRVVGFSQIKSYQR